jgi:hypothetical protein
VRISDRTNAKTYVSLLDANITLQRPLGIRFRTIAADGLTRDNIAKALTVIEKKGLWGLVVVHYRTAAM